jgi:transcriptional pleiotropic regulator of transition state genes
MKATGIVRKVDELGRVVVPIELRRALGIEIRDSVEIFTADDSVIIRKSRVNCIFCGDENDITEFKGKPICPNCLNEIKEIDISESDTESET